MYRVCDGNFSDKMRFLMEYAGRPEQEMADSWYTDDFDATWRDVLTGCQRCWNQITAHKENECMAYKKARERYYRDQSSRKKSK